MTLSPPIAEPSVRRPFRKHRDGFTLVEITLALGIAVTSIVVVLGLFGSGLSNLDQSQNRTSSARIAQLISSEMSQSEWSSLFDSGTGKPVVYNTPRYFDAQGDEVQNAAQAVYLAKPVLFAPDNEAGYNYSSLSTPEFLRVVVEVLNMPNGTQPAEDSNHLWTVNAAQAGRLSKVSFLVARTSHS